MISLNKPLVNLFTLSDTVISYKVGQGPSQL